MGLELFPTSVPPGARLTNGWVNEAGRILNRVSGARPGSTMHGLRGGAVQSDNPLERLEVHPCFILDYFDPNNVGDNFPVNIFNRGPLMKGVIPDYEPDPIDTWQNFTVEQEYEVDTGPCLNQFLLPGDCIFVRWDSTSGRMVVINPPGFRIGRTVEQVANDAEGQVRIYSNSSKDVTILGTEGLNTNDDNNKTRLLVQAWNQNCNRGLAVPNDAEVLLSYEVSTNTWHITCWDTGQVDLLHFKLVGDLTVETQEVEAEVELIYSGTTPAIGTEVTLTNPLAGCTGDTYRHAGSEGCRGIAKWAETDLRYYIIQIDCDPTPP